MTGFGISVVGLLVYVGSYFAIRNPGKAFRIGMALVPWYGLDADVGVRVTAQQLFLAPLLLRFLGKGEAFVVYRAVPQVFWILLFYALIWSLVCLPFLPDASVSGGALRAPEVRAGIQIFMFFFTSSPILMGARYCRSNRDFLLLLRSYVISSFVLALFGVFQLGLWILKGTDPFPLGGANYLVTGNDEGLKSALFHFSNHELFRVSSLGGEPKNCGQSLALAGLVSLASYSKGIFIIESGFFIIVAVILVMMIATQSTGAYVIFAIGLVAIAGAGATKGRYLLKTMQLLMFGLSLAAVVVWISEMFLGIAISDIVYARTLGRSEESELGWLEDFDGAIWAFLFDNPTYLLFGVGLGNVHLYADSYLLPQVAAYAGGTSFTAKAGYLRLMSELGVVGISLMLLFILTALRKIKSFLAFFKVPFIIAAIAYLVGGQFVAFCYFVGAICGLCYRHR